MATYIPELPPLEAQQELRIKAKTFLADSKVKPEILKKFMELPPSEQAAAAAAYLDSGKRTPSVALADAVEQLSRGHEAALKDAPTLAAAIDRVFPGRGDLAAPIPAAIAGMMLEKAGGDASYDFAGEAQRKNAQMLTVPERSDIDRLQGVYDNLSAGLRDELERKDKSMPFYTPLPGLQAVRDADERLRQMMGEREKNSIGRIMRLDDKYKRGKYTPAVDSYGDFFNKGYNKNRNIFDMGRKPEIGDPEAQRQIGVLGQRLAIDLAGQSRKEGWTYGKELGELGKRSKAVEDAKAERPRLADFVAKVGGPSAMEAYRALAANHDASLPRIGNIRDIAAKFHADPGYGVDAVNDIKKVYGVAVLTTPQWIRRNVPEPNGLLKAYEGLPMESRDYFERQDKTSPLFQPQREIVAAALMDVNAKKEAALDKAIVEAADKRIEIASQRDNGRFKTASERSQTGAPGGFADGSPEDEEKMGYAISAPVQEVEEETEYRGFRR